MRRDGETDGKRQMLDPVILSGTIEGVYTKTKCRLFPAQPFMLDKPKVKETSFIKSHFCLK